MNVQTISQQILEYIPKIPVSDLPATADLSAYEGKLKAYSIIKSYDLALDRIEMEPATETLRTKINRAILFDAYDGTCNLHYLKDGEKIIRKLNKFSPCRIPPTTPFVIKTNGSRCSLFCGWRNLMADTTLIDLLTELVQALQKENKEQTDKIHRIAMTVNRLAATQRQVCVNEFKRINDRLPNEREVAKADEEAKEIKQKVEKNATALLKISLYVAAVVSVCGVLGGLLKWMGVL